jgi:hypothetical protein
MKTDSIRCQIQAELDDAARSRQAGNQGRARVCARRAAGLAARQHLQKHHPASPRLNAYRALLALKESPLPLPRDAEQAVERLTMRVNQAHQLPPEVDLIAEARTLISVLQETGPEADQPED